MRVGHRASWIALIAAIVGGCSDPPAMLDDAAIVDAGEATDAVVPIDSPEGIDAAPAPDGEMPPDADGDGIATALDCDDEDPAVGRSSTRSCTGACAPGTETCTDGVWGTCSAPTDCACSTPGMMRTVACGRCGMASQRCGSDMRWEMPSECFGERECFAGAIERDLAMCGELARLCDGSCMWLPWETRTPPSECEAGEMDVSPAGCTGGQVRDRVCTSSCTWMGTSACRIECSRAPAASRTGADPVCIPAGDFVLGAEGAMEGSPVRRIVLSEFWIDRLPVTKARYEMCVAAGSCPMPDAASRTYYDAYPSTSYPGYIPVGAAESFCAWDGGALPTEFQWEKAARGPHPDARPHSWGTEGPDPCRRHPDAACPDYRFAISAATFPDAISPWGVRLMGSLRERTSTRFQYGDHSWLTDGDVDPPPPTGGTQHVARGAIWFGTSPVPSAFSASDRRRGLETPHAVGFRCVY